MTLRLVDPVVPTPKASDVDVRRRFKELGEIESIKGRAEFPEHFPGGVYPAVLRAGFVGGLVCLVLVFTLWLSWASGLMPLLPKEARQYLFFAPYAVGFGAALWIVLTSKLPNSWSGVLINALAEYDPLDVQAYRDLQHRTRVTGSLDYMYLAEWCHRERAALEDAARLRSPRAACLTRKV